MMNRINNILIGLLWLLASTLGATFWFNTMFGFNIFSMQHWQHLAYMQASGQAVKPSFYISMVVIVIIVTFGLYKLLQPRFRQITLPIFDRTQRPAPTAQPAAPTTKIQQTVVVSDTGNTISVAPQTIPVAPAAPATPTGMRPPRPNIPTVTRTEPVPHVPLSSAPTPHVNPESKYADIRAVFESAGYVYKGAPRIRGVQIATIAIGTGEVLWIGAVGVNNADMQRAVQTLSGVFSDTLDDIEIHINPFIITPSDTADSDTGILQFANVDQLREYIMAHPNTPVDAEESENFDAYSGYIGTVVDYIGKI